MILNRSSIPIKYTVVAAVTFALSDQIVISLSPAPHPHFDPSCVCDLPFPLLRTSPFLPIPMHHLSICVFHRFSSFFIVFPFPAKMASLQDSSRAGLLKG